MMRYDNLVEKAIAYGAYNGKIKRKYNLRLSTLIAFVSLAGNIEKTYLEIQL
ncbi:MAG: hypothetical protein QNJ18_15400 [Xenococcaceae cyanobacterium MO_167.B52]|nr:hypothetical protein [Xenococcaceae cyanobacterium MO_167.B52]